jgi:hypothetical protein
MRDTRVGAKVSPFAVDREKVPRFGYPENVSEIYRGGMPGCVNERILWMENLYAFPAQGVDNPEDIFLVARD